MGSVTENPRRFKLLKTMGFKLWLKLLKNPPKEQPDNAGDFIQFGLLVVASLCPPTLHLHPHVVTFIRLPGLRRLEVLGDTPAKGMALEP